MKKEINEDLDKYWYNKRTHKVPQTNLVFDKDGNHHKEGELKIEFANYRAFENTLFDDKVISSKAYLYLCVFDLDDDLEEKLNEKIRVKINGKTPQYSITPWRNNFYLKSNIANPDGKWQIYELEFDASRLKFPKPAKSGSYPEPKINTVTLELDRNNKGWALEVDWAIISYDAISPTFLVHGASQDEKFWEGYISGFLPKHVVGDVDFYRALKANFYPESHDISIKGKGEERNIKGGATIPIGGDEIIQIFPDLCKKWGTFSFNAVCHSKGGLWFRDAMAKFKNNSKTKYLNVCHVITLDTPHCGSVLADYANAFYKESEVVFDREKNKPEKQRIYDYLNPSGSIPMHYVEIRSLYWPKDPRIVIEGYGKKNKNEKTELMRYYWNQSYDDLGAIKTNVFNSTNIPQIYKYHNFDDSKPVFHAYSADSDLNGNNKMDDWFDWTPWFDNGEWFPLDQSFNIMNPGATYEDFFTRIYQSLNKIVVFQFATDQNNIFFQNKIESGNISGNDLFVSVESSHGVQLLPGGISIDDIFTHVPSRPQGWWNGSEPDAVNHGTVCSEEAGRYAVENIIKPLR